MVGSVVGIGGGFVNIWELITSDDAATNDSLATIGSDIRNLQRATVDTTFAHDILEQESVTINGSSSIVFRCNLEESSSAWILVWIRIAILIEFSKRIEFITNSVARST